MELKRYQDYSRKEVHDLFSPDSNFKTGSGTWGLQGIVKVPKRPNDFVFFVTYGQSQAGHVFDEGITSNGVLSWQSQPRQDLEDLRIKKFINHDEEIDNIYLFLRTKAGMEIPYTYLGKLKYIKHDSIRQKPVYFQWQILKWNEIDDSVTRRINLNFIDKKDLSNNKPLDIQKNILNNSEPPFLNHKEHAIDTFSFRAYKGTDYSHQDKKNKELGFKGEKLVLKYEQERLKSIGLEHLADKIIHASKTIGDGCGYDIMSFNEDSTERFIEVKTTRGSISTEFYLTANELEYSKAMKNSYYLYRVYNYNDKYNSGELYCLSGSINENFILKPTQYKVKR